MPFAVFRRHQRTLMAALAIFAMVAFSLDFSLLQGRFSGAGEDPVVAELYGRTIHRGDLQEMALERARANRFMAMLTGRPDFFGGMSDRALVDALVLRHEAEQLGIPANKDLAVRWLVASSGQDPQQAAEMFDTIYRREFSDQVTDERLLMDIADQLRLRIVSALPGAPQVTPLDLYQSYRDQYAKVSAFAVPFPAEEFLDKVADPTDQQVREYYERYKDDLPERGRETPGFKTPRRVQVESVSADVDALAREIKPTLSEEELRAYYQAHEDQFPAPPGELPRDLFAGDPDAKLTPSDAFPEVRPAVASQVALERAEETVDQKFGEVRDQMEQFIDRYFAVQERNEEAKEKRRPAEDLPAPGDLLQKAATDQQLTYEKTPLFDREAEGSTGSISAAHQGTGPLSEGKSFSESVFGEKETLYDPLELTDNAGRRYLAWKLRDVPARVPPLDQVRDQVVRAWKLEKARDLAEQAAQAFADRVREAGGDIKAVAESRPLLTTTAVPRLQPGSSLNPFQMSPEPPRPSEIPQIPDAGEALREALFGLGPESVAVAPDQPKSTYYVLTLNQADPVSLGEFLGPNSPMRIQWLLLDRNPIFAESVMKRGEDWMQRLRARAGLKPDWIPPDEVKKEGVES